MTQRDPRTGRYTVDTSNTALSADSKFEVMRELGIDNVSAEPSPNTILYPHHAPAGDVLAQGGQSSPLRPRTQRLVSQAGRDVLEQHAKPDRSTMHADRMREAAGPDAGDLDPVHYLVGDITGIED